ncbi:UPF0029-domain-containing protein [Gymnopus androsaceus JB14]|uniref:UPF0029-domain-containing protein n=1 Tax=Gymnopus androsaceus JB14 TaxID=1447944 RepID=A0A6A4I4N7_9AGAR|nr:UPF0029-domain-containing protein [Gymnopus androsaceus JB14]
MDNLIEELLSSPEREAVGSELEVLKSIYGDDAIRSWKEAPTDDTIRFEVTIDFPSPYDEVKITTLISLSSTYPADSPPQLQLLSRYIGAFGVDSNLFGSVLRTYISANGVEWTRGAVCVFDGLQNVLDRCVQWYEDRLSAQRAGELLREDAAESNLTTRPIPSDPEDAPPSSFPVDRRDIVALPPGIQIFEAEPILDRKSAFVGRACAITDPSQVPLILSYLSSDRKISRAAHPIINAWRCQVGKTLHQDNEDDGETAAGGRLSHLLQILEINNVLVIVTRYYGGIHLGPDRFKHINQAARNALELGGFLDDEGHNKSRGRKH